MNNRIKIIGFSILYPFFSLYYAVIKKQFPKVLNSKKTLEKIIKEKKSLSRFGDGEFRLMAGRSIGFQNNNSSLAQELRRVIESSDTRCLIGIPDVFNGLTRFRFEAKFFWLYSIVTHWSKWKSFISNKSYVDSLCSRFYMDLVNKSVTSEILSLWKKVWKHKDIVIIEGEHTKMGVGNDLFDNARSIKRIICPSKDAFSIYSQIFNEALRLKNDTLILIALGPTASVLAFDLAINGYQAIDTGHLDLEYNWFKNKAINKEAIAGRMINELNNSKFDEIKSDDYEKQIICKFSKD